MLGMMFHIPHMLATKVHNLWSLTAPVEMSVRDLSSCTLITMTLRSSMRRGLEGIVTTLTATSQQALRVAEVTMVLIAVVSMVLDSALCYSDWQHELVSGSAEKFSMWFEQLISISRFYGDGDIFVVSKSLRNTMSRPSCPLKWLTCEMQNATFCVCHFLWIQIPGCGWILGGWPFFRLHALR